MSAKIERIEKEKEFKPFRFITEVENEDQAKDLWCRFNLQVSLLKSENNIEYDNWKADDFMIENWRVLNHELIAQGIKLQSSFPCG
jgi:hypothetical protein